MHQAAGPQMHAKFENEAAMACMPPLVEDSLVLPIPFETGDIEPPDWYWRMPDSQGPRSILADLRTVDEERRQYDGFEDDEGATSPAAGQDGAADTGTVEAIEYHLSGTQWQDYQGTWYYEFDVRGQPCRLVRRKVAATFAGVTSAVRRSDGTWICCEQYTDDEGKRQHIAGVFRNDDVPVRTTIHGHLRVFRDHRLEPTYQRTWALSPASAGTPAIQEQMASTALSVSTVSF